MLDAVPLPGKGERTMVWDSEIKGFGARVTSTGSRTYILRYRMGGRDTPVRTITIGQHGSPWTPEQARRHAAELLTMVRSGRDVVAEREAKRTKDGQDADVSQQRLFEVVVEDWFEKHVKRGGLRTHRDIRGVVDRDLKPSFNGRAINKINRKEVTKALETIGLRSSSASNKAHKWLRQLFNWLTERGDLEHSPLSGVKTPFSEDSRTRVLPLGELVVLWVALDQVEEPFRSFYRFLILVGQRLREASNAPWSEFDLEAGDWFLPKARTKAKRDHLVPMSEQAIELIEDLHPDVAARKGPVFTTNGLVGIAGFSKLKKEIDAAVADLLMRDPNARALAGEHLAPWVVHDLRRSLTTGCQAMGIDLMHTEAVLNHAIGKKASGTARVYHLYEYYDEKAVALERWGDLVEKAVALFRAGDVEGVKALDPARRTPRRRRRPRSPI
ncbi:MAG TPA: site-specific integrase [Allosphingosinicella sp.]|jgi:integrase